MPVIVLPSDVGASADGEFRTLLDLELPTGEYQLTSVISGSTDSGFTVGPHNLVDADTGDLLGSVLAGYDSFSGSGGRLFTRSVLVTPLSVTGPSMLVRQRIAQSPNTTDPVTGLTYHANDVNGAPFATYVQAISDSAGGIDLVLASVRATYTNPWETP